MLQNAPEGAHVKRALAYLVDNSDFIHVHFNLSDQQPHDVNLRCQFSVRKVIQDSLGEVAKLAKYLLIMLLTLFAVFGFGVLLGKARFANTCLLKSGFEFPFGDQTILVRINQTTNALLHPVQQLLDRLTEPFPTLLVGDSSTLEFQPSRAWLAMKASPASP